MLIKIDDLQKDDEILIGSGRTFKWLKVLNPPILHKSGRRMKAVRCSIKVIKVLSTKWDYKLKQSIPTTKNAYECTGIDHNARISIDLNYKFIWLISRNGRKI